MRECFSIEQREPSFRFRESRSGSLNLIRNLIQSTLNRMSEKHLTAGKLSDSLDNRL
jgi:hypothetical protein